MLSDFQMVVLLEMSTPRVQIPGAGLVSKTKQNEFVQDLDKKPGEIL